MQCSACGTQLPQGVAYCPSCGSMTPYQVASTGVSPSEATVASSSAQAQPSQYSYIPPNPYDTPSLTPPPPPPRHRKLGAWSITVLIILVLTTVAVGGILYARTGSLLGQSQAPSPTTQVVLPTATPSPTTQAAQPIPTPSTIPSTQTPQDLYTQITQSTPVLDDSLRINGASNWVENTSASGSCAFTGGAYHASVRQQDAYTLCMAQATNYSDLAYQVEMTIVAGELGGMVFRTDSSQSKYYSFFIERSGNFTLITSVDDTGTQDRVLHKGASAHIKTGLNETNLLTVIARGTHIYLYINQQYIASANDSTYQSGQIGVFGGTFTQVPADIVFSRIRIWKA